MTSISSRIVPASTTLSLIRSFVRDFHEQRHPIHEVDANVLAGELFSLPAATRHPDFDVSGAGQAAAAVKMEGRSWILVCHDSMSGQRPVATAHINVGMNLNSNGVQLVLSVTAVRNIYPHRQLPYRLERVLVRNITTMFWSYVDNPATRDEAPVTYPKTKCA